MPPKLTKELKIHQTFLNERYPVLSLKVITEQGFDNTLVNWLLHNEQSSNAQPSRLVGMHPAYTKLGRLAALAICVGQKIVVVTEIKKRSSPPPSRRILNSKLLSNASRFTVVAFNAHELVLALHNDMGLTCSRVVDLFSLPPKTREIVKTVKTVTRARLELFEDTIRDAFKPLIYDKNMQTTLAQQAWFAWLIADHPEAKRDLNAIPIIDTSRFSKSELNSLAKSVEGLIIRDLGRASSDSFIIPLNAIVYQGNKVFILQQKYADRLRNGPHQEFQANIRGNVTLPGSIIDIRGKRAVLKIPNLDNILDPGLQSLTVSGINTPTKAEQNLAVTILKTLQRRMPLFDNRWMNILFPLPPSAVPDVPKADEDSWNEKQENVNFDYGVTSGIDLWSSAAVVADPGAGEEVEDGWAVTEANEELKDTCNWAAAGASDWAVIGDDPWMSSLPTPSPTILQEDYAPPKDDPWSIKPTRSDSSSPMQEQEPRIEQLVYTGPLNPSQEQAVYDMLDIRKPVSIIQGPPGTGKTTAIAAYITEILSRPGKACLVVAQSNIAIKNVAEKLYSSGILDWTLLVSSEYLMGWHEHLYERLPSTNVLPSRDMKKPITSRIVLCTLSMLSNGACINVTRHLHMEYVVVEEASQIPMADYIPMVAEIGKFMKKMSFIGDDKQLPPFASEDTEALDSVFEHEALLKINNVSFLNIQYRMPPAIGSFLSREVYYDLLESWDEHPVHSPCSAQFVDVDSGEEPVKKSFINSLEASVAISIATLLDQKQKAFKIITPYDAQRDLLEQMLRASDLCWANTCFTVDSFQGNEEDFIIISLVRTKSVGFLQDLHRSNVMLSRARRGMFVCSNRSFLQSSYVQSSLIGRMAQEWMSIEGGWIQNTERLEEQIHID